MKTLTKTNYNNRDRVLTLDCVLFSKSANSVFSVLCSMAHAIYASSALDDSNGYGEWQQKQRKKQGTTEKQNQTRKKQSSGLTINSAL